MNNEQSQTTTKELDSVDSRNRRLLNEACGQLFFNNYAEAENALSRIPQESVFYLDAQLNLLAIDHDLARFEQGIKRGLRLIDEFGVEAVPLITVVNCLIYQHRFVEALELVWKHRFAGMCSPSGLYDLACIESKLGRFGLALQLLELALRGTEQYDDWALFDFHLLPLWRHLGACRESDLAPETRRCLSSPVFLRLLDGASHQSGFVPIDYEALRALPSDLRQLFQVQFQSGRFHINHRTRDTKPDHFRRICTWQRRRTLISAAFLRRALHIADGSAELQILRGPAEVILAQDAEKKMGLNPDQRKNLERWRQMQREGKGKTLKEAMVSAGGGLVLQEILMAEERKAKKTSEPPHGKARPDDLSEE